MSYRINSPRIFEVRRPKGSAKISEITSNFDAPDVFHDSSRVYESFYRYNLDFSTFAEGRYPRFNSYFKTSKSWDIAEQEAKYKSQFKTRLKVNVRRCFDLESMDWWSKSSAEVELRDAIAINGELAREAISDLYRECAGNEGYLLCLMIALSHLSYDEVGSQGQIIGLAALSHKSLVVREAGIRMFEMWEDVDSIRLLRQHQVSPPWLMEYMLQVINDFGA